MLEQEKQTHTHYVSKLINQPLLKNFDKRGWKQMISKSSFPQVTLQYKFRIILLLKKKYLLTSEGQIWKNKFSFRLH